MTFGQRSFIVIYFKVTVLKNSLIINSLEVASPASKRALRVNLRQAVRREEGNLAPPTSRSGVPVSPAATAHQNSSIFRCRYLSMESMPCAEPQIFLSTSHSRSLACSSSSFMLQRTRAFDSSSTCSGPVAAG